MLGRKQSPYLTLHIETGFFFVGRAFLEKINGGKCVFWRGVRSSLARHEKYRAKTIFTTVMIFD
jgi:hypothetical protein